MSEKLSKKSKLKVTRSFVGKPEDRERFVSMVAKMLQMDTEKDRKAA
jgi:hypothetical protein